MSLFSSCTWTIEHISRSLSSLTEPHSYCFPNSNAQLHFDLRPFSNSQYALVTITFNEKTALPSDAISSGTLSYQFSLLDANKEKRCFYVVKQSTGMVNFEVEGGHVQAKICRDALLDPANSLLKNDTLTFCCDVYHSFETLIEAKCEQLQATIKTLTKANKQLQQVACSEKAIAEKQIDGLILEMGKLNVNLDRLKKSLAQSKAFTGKLEALLNRPQYADITFHLQGKEIQAHKALLIARSPVFATMFSSPMKESTEGRVDITNVDPEIFERLLRYIYTGNTDSLDRFKVTELFMAAHLYEVDTLVDFCAQFMIDSISADTIASYLAIADVYSSAELKKKCLAFFAANPVTAMQSADWKEFIKTDRQTLLLEIMAYVVGKSM